MPCSISLWAISSRSMPASNHIGRAERPTGRGPWRCRRGAASREFGLVRVRPGNPKEGPDLNLPLFPRSGASLPQQRSASTRPRQALSTPPRDANSPPTSRAPSGRARRPLQRSRDHPKHTVANVIAVAVVDRLEAVKLERQDDDRCRLPPRVRRSSAPLVAEPLAIEQSGHAVGRGDLLRARFAFDALFGFMLEVGVAAPTEQDQRDIEGQRHRRDLERGLSIRPGDREALEETRCRSR